METPLTLADIGEFGLIRRIQEILGTHSSEILVGGGDDAATILPQARPLVITTDTMVESIHFSLEWSSASDLAWKALASNLSDLAAKGAESRFGLITLGLPPATPVPWVEEFYLTLAAFREEWSVEFLGGDTVLSNALFISMTLLGYQIAPEPIRLHTAHPGDWILVTGTLGDAAMGLELLQGKDAADCPPEAVQFLRSRFLRPQPRLREARRLLETATPSAMTDLSDGLARDLPKICDASHVGARLHVSFLPLSDPLRCVAGDRASHYAWCGGEDYELLLSLPPAQAEKLLSEWDQDFCRLSIIGEIVEFSQDVTVMGWEGTLPMGFDHFKTRRLSEMRE